MSFLIMPLRFSLSNRHERQAGLYSAVLSAFIVVAFPNLQNTQVTSGLMLNALERIADHTASYTMHVDMLNSTTATTGTSITTTTPGPSANDIRVNVLWFASLMLSLIAASFAILVKQWLREYLVVKNPSPQARLRIRHLREPQLAAWRVIEIAAVLPLLLQLSLGLFFVGMCYFTSEIHSSIGHTTIPLVAGWAACFLGVTLLPFVFPRCPYRTPLLKGIVYSWHCRFYGNNKLRNTRTEETPVTHRARSAVRNVWRQCSRLYADQGQRLSRTRSTIRNVWRRFCCLYADWQQHIRDSDEAIAAASGDADIDILASADAIQSNDELFGTTILEAVNQIRPNAAQLQQFVLSALRSRVQLPEDSWTDELPVMNLSGLSASPRDVLIELIVQHLLSDESHAGSGRSSRNAFIDVLIYLHGASIGQELPQSGFKFIHENMEAICPRGYLTEECERTLHFMLWLNDRITNQVFRITVVEVINQIRPNAGQLQRFIYSALRSRVRLPEDAWIDALPVMDLETLAVAPRDTMIELVGQHLRSWQARRGSGCNDESAFIAVLMKLGDVPTGQELSETGKQTLKQVFVKEGKWSCRTLVKAAGKSEDIDRKVNYILRTMARLIYNIDCNPDVYMSHVRIIFDTYAEFVRRDGDTFRIENSPVYPPSDLSRYPFDYVSYGCRCSAAWYLLYSMEDIFADKHWSSDSSLQASTRTVHDTLTLALQLIYQPLIGLNIRLDSSDVVRRFSVVFQNAWRDTRKAAGLVSFFADLPAEHICDRGFHDILLSLSSYSTGSDETHIGAMPPFLVLHMHVAHSENGVQPVFSLL